MLPCRCRVFHDTDVDEFSLSSPVQRFERCRLRGAPWWWLDYRRCLDCGQDWLVAQEERLNDIYVVKRLTASEANQIINLNAWPSRLQTYEELLIIGKSAGHSARYFDAEETLPIAIDLVSQRLSMTNAELASLVNVSMQAAVLLRERADAHLLRHGNPFGAPSAA